MRILARTAVAFVAAAFMVAGPGTASGAPVVSGFSFRERPEAGRPATLEIEVRGEADPVDDVHVHWGDGAVSYATLRRPGPLEPRGSPQRVMLDHVYGRPGGYGITVQALSPEGQGESSGPVAVLPCGSPRASIKFLSRPRVGHKARLRVLARDADSLVTKLRIAWGDGVRRSVAVAAPAGAQHGDTTELVLGHRFRTAGRFTAWLEIVSTGNPPECGSWVERFRRRWTIRVPRPTR